MEIIAQTKEECSFNKRNGLEWVNNYNLRLFLKLFHEFILQTHTRAQISLSLSLSLSFPLSISPPCRHISICE